MNINEFISNALAANRATTLANSPQLALGEAILKLEAIPDKEKPIKYDFGEYPESPRSWRGSYNELAIGYGTTAVTAAWLLYELKSAIGKEYIGYKGGEFIMNKRTPLWVANCGESGISGYKGKDYPSVGVIDISDGDTVTIITDVTEF